VNIEMRLCMSNDKFFITTVGVEESIVNARRMTIYSSTSTLSINSNEHSIQCDQ
jgi:hypothetical protein